MNLERFKWITVHLPGLIPCHIPMTILPTCPDLLGVLAGGIYAYLVLNLLIYTEMRAVSLTVVSTVARVK